MTNLEAVIVIAMVKNNLNVTAVANTPVSYTHLTLPTIA